MVIVGEGAHWVSPRGKTKTTRKQVYAFDISIYLNFRSREWHHRGSWPMHGVRVCLITEAVKPRVETRFSAAEFGGCISVQYLGRPAHTVSPNLFITVTYIHPGEMREIRGGEK